MSDIRKSLNSRLSHFPASLWRDRHEKLERSNEISGSVLFLGLIRRFVVRIPAATFLFRSASG